MVVTRTMLSKITPQSFDISGPFLGPLKSSLKILLSRACDIASLAEKDLHLNTGDVKLVADVKTLVKEIAKITLNIWPRCIIPDKNKLWKVLVACDGSTIASSATIYLLSKSMESGQRECNMAQTSSLIFRFSIPLNESKSALLGMYMPHKIVEIIIRHPDIDPDIIMIDIFMDASCLGHLLRPDISIKNRVINNVIVNIRNHNTSILKILPEATIRFG